MSISKWLVEPPFIQMLAILIPMEPTWSIPTLGLSGEAGEVAEKVKKVIRDKGGEFDDDTRLAICKELGDVLWYVAQIASELNLDLSNVAQGNLDKLADRAKRGKIKGNGDDR